jgi:7-carboxy-7-deazaguanine synthase
MVTTSVPIAEIFGPTIQGEGALAGVPTYFLRVGGCDFSCVWCDSAHAVLAEEVRKLPHWSEEEILEQLIHLSHGKPGPDWLTISGGNPALYDLSMVVQSWQHRKSPSGWASKVAVETQGTKWQPWFGDVNLLVVSPKPPSSTMNTSGLDVFMRCVAAAEENFCYRRLQDPGIPPDDWRMVFKVVVFDEIDYRFARDLHMRWPLIKFYLSCGTAMGGLTGEWLPSCNRPSLNNGGYVDTKVDLLARYSWLAELAMNDYAMSDVAVLPQLHALTWGARTRGV